MISIEFEAHLMFFPGVGAAWRSAGVEKGSTVAIFGLGSIGLAVRIPFFLLCFSSLFSCTSLDKLRGVRRLQKGRDCVVLLESLVLM